MYTFFLYNWQVRDQWFEWCQQLDQSELLKQRVGGIGSILHTLLHIVDVEHSWIQAIQGKDDILHDFNDFTTLEDVVSLSHKYREDIKEFFNNHPFEQDHSVKAAWIDDTFTKEEVLQHVIAHEIHHIGQLSIWARELGLNPVSANLIGRGLFSS
ncbi:DUF664 domain-containing protein [Ornithinibacillus sp. L9]|uniref:DUF664 domain-containing protein n=1 Tax=Ornithinibacillus caprae TaxID=2678566 RepID=A0A6N8FF38_9BACI|nr:DinB family protein [Ornithinibacillus caprae]MUK88170.1 DUF664 domain-containing protein [Ornithinibacillus caprae]